MARKTVYIPDELIEQLERSGTDIGQKLSREFQDYLRSRLAMAASPQWSGDFESAAGWSLPRREGQANADAWQGAETWGS